ncbi:lysozyme family protein [Terrilactibacillus sp. S3-3]|nr:lysozyme family protein [Terrilactibacillus sp. S3-3]
MHLAEYTPVMMALMEQESHGKGGDPMQSSESAGLAPNTIKDPKLSIRQGVKHFRVVLLYGEKKKVDFSTIIQAYNMGKGYIDFVAAHGRKNTVNLAKRFSLAQVKKDPQRYNCGDDSENFRYPYCYGDFTYSTKVNNDVVSLVSRY